eukprot:COSAG05_NODE_1249_length_5388_cov_42.102477_6_plen_228_part_00
MLTSPQLTSALCRTICSILSGHECKTDSAGLHIVHVFFAVLGAAVVYLAFASARSRSRGGGWVPHRDFFTALSGLVVDGVTASTTMNKTVTEVAPLLSSSIEPIQAQSRATDEQGKRRLPGLPGWQASCNPVPTEVHRAAATGDAKALAQLLQAAAGSNGRPPPGCFDSGDVKRWTAFHIACAGGHVACCQLLLQSKACDVTLRNDEGLTGWELAEQMQQVAVLALR